MLGNIGTRLLPKWTADSIIELVVGLSVSPILAWGGYKLIITYTYFSFIWLMIVIYTVETYLLSEILHLILSHHVAEFVELILEFAGVLI